MAAFVGRWELSLLLKFPSYKGKQPVDTFFLMLISHSLPMKLLGEAPSQAGSHLIRPTLDNGPSESPVVVFWPSLQSSLFSSSPTLLSPGPGHPLTEEEDFNIGPEHHQPAVMSLQDQIQVLMAQQQ